MEVDPRAMLAEGAIRLSQREIRVARRAFEMAARAAEAGGDRAVHVEALALVARCYFLEDLPADGQIWLELAEKNSDREEPLGYSRCRQVRGLFERSLGNQDLALEIFEDLYKFCRQEGLFERALSAAHHLAMLAPLDGQVIWARRAIAAAQEAGNEALLAILWNNLGLTYDRMIRPMEALASYRRARWYHYRTGAEREKLIADWAVGRALRLVERDREAFLWLSDVALRAEIRWQANPMPEQQQWRGHAHQELGEVQAQLGLVPEALQSLEISRRSFLGLESGTLEEGVYEAVLDRIEQLSQTETP
ncbi:MAG: tetratricopeptide (TPR) repeat protein [Glaciecola sp.]|jgi:tetratricopeptide (TPR) repeat protein